VSTTSLFPCVFKLALNIFSEYKAFISKKMHKDEVLCSLYRCYNLLSLLLLLTLPEENQQYRVVHTKQLSGQHKPHIKVIFSTLCVFYHSSYFQLGHLNYLGMPVRTSTNLSRPYEERFFSVLTTTCEIPIYSSRYVHVKGRLPTRAHNYSSAN
jgi:hypothetical protein